MDGQDSSDQSTPEMTQFVQNLLTQMQNRFQTMSDALIGNIDEMGKHIDELEKSIKELKDEMGTTDPKAAKPAKEPT